MTTVTKTNPPGERRARIAHGLGAAVGAFVVATIGLSIAIYLTGGETLASNDFAPHGMSFFEVTGQAAFGIASAVMSLVLGFVGVLTATVATIVSVALGALGIVGAVVVTAGVVTGPILMIGAIAILIKRRYFPDVI